MNSLSQALTILCDQMLAFDNTTTSVYTSISSMLHNLTGIPDTFSGVDVVRSDAEKIIKLTDEIQSLSNTTWGGVNVLLNNVKDTPESDVPSLDAKYAVEINEVCTNVNNLGVMVTDMCTQSNKIGITALELLKAVLDSKSE